MRAVVGRFLLFLVLSLCASCNSIRRDIWLASIGDDLMDVVHGGDRGLWSYRAKIREATTERSGPYLYRAPAHVNQYRVNRAVHGLGGTRTENAEQLAQVFDVLFQVARNDPTPLVRSSACRQIGRVLARLSIDPHDRIDPDPTAEAKIHTLVSDLFTLQVKISKGVRVANSDVLQLMKLLKEQRPPRLHTAIELVRALSLPPIARTAPGSIRDFREKIVPGMVRDAGLVVLREIACGHPLTRTRPDRSPTVRSAAARVLAGLRSAVARDSAIARLNHELDPPERDATVRVDLVQYLAAIGGPEAFDACLLRMEDTDLSVRYHVNVAMQTITGLRTPRTRKQWEAWRAKRPRWQLKKLVQPANG